MINQQTYNTVNTIVPIGIFIISTIYVLYGAKKQCINEIFNFRLMTNDDKSFSTIGICVFIEMCLAGCFIGYIFRYHKFYNFSCVSIIAINSGINIVIEFFNLKLITDENIIKVLTENNNKIKKYYKRMDGIVVGFSGIVLGFSLYFFMNNSINYRVYVFIIFIISTVLTFIIFPHSTLLKNITNIQQVKLIDKDNKIIATGKIFKIVDGFITIVQSDKNVKFINKDQVHTIKYVEVIKKNMNDEQIKEITKTLIEKELLTTKTDNEETAVEIAKFINKLKEETNK